MSNRREAKKRFAGLGRRHAGGTLLMAAVAAVAPAQDPFGFTPEEIEKLEQTTPEERRREAYVEMVHELQAQTEQLWGAKVGAPIEPVILDKQGLKDLLRRLLEEELAKPNVQGSTEVLKFLEMVPEDIDFEQMVQGLMEAQVGGLFNPTDSSLYVVDTFNPNGFLGKIILSHEIGHAIQHAHKDLAEWFEKEPNLDRQKAKQCVVEGDATVLMIDWATKNANMLSLMSMMGEFETQMEDLNEAPQVVVQDLMFSYLGGAAFCGEVQRAHPRDWRRRVFSDPPSSSEQILHPEKYLGNRRDEPTSVTIAPPPAGYEESLKNVFGEWSTRLFLTLPGDFPQMNMLALNVEDVIASEPVATAGAAGWGGDVVGMYRKEDGTRLLVWKSVWDSERDAEEFLQALMRRLKTFTSLENGQWGATAVYSNGRKAAFRRTGDTVDFVLATNEPAMMDGVRMVAGGGTAGE